mgnify:CR=1 FL=1
MPARFHVVVTKPFDRMIVGQKAVLSQGGFDRMTSKMPGYVELQHEECEDGTWRDAKGKTVKSPFVPENRAAEPVHQR